ncbi:hypothetical protein SLEP1_g35646 [Rubroshorea leprosula]|uniref:RRM domain-containing protein n=1 Tax=Rubroshorea leprosula TaxID=152421 RepID=A0AAV5KNS7_9ROSI|nr:hypothetical protein SLEP1_g35646 [Rubroshorea leprosula]
MTMRSKNKPSDERSLTSRLPMYDQGLLKNATSYLFTRFPQNWTPKRLWHLFATYGVGLGRIVDVFIPKKKDRRGNSFGFVRFAGVKNKGKLEKSLKMICFGTEKLRVTQAIERKPPQSTPTPPRHLPPPPLPETFKSKTFAEALLHGPSASNALNTKPQPQQSVCMDEFTAAKSILEMGEEMEDSSWLCNCATGEVHAPNLIPGLQQTFWENGFSDITTVPMGGNKILLKCDDEDSINHFISKEENWWGKWFKRIKPWSPSDVAEERLAWIRVTGLPLHVWNQRSFEKIGNFLGSFVLVDQFTINKECLDAARILISIVEIGQIDKEISIKVRDHLYSLKIMEDRWRTDPWWLKASSVYESDEFGFDEQSEYESDRLSGGWSLPFDEEIEQPKQIEKEPLLELMALLIESANSKSNTALSNGVIALGKLAPTSSPREFTQSSV